MLQAVSKWAPGIRLAFDHTGVGVSAKHYQHTETAHLCWHVHA